MDFQTKYLPKKSIIYKETFIIYVEIAINMVGKIGPSSESVFKNKEYHKIKIDS